MMFKIERWCNIIQLIDWFFLVFIFNLFVTLYSIYLFFDIKIFHNAQGSKLNIKFSRR